MLRSFINTRAMKFANMPLPRFTASAKHSLFLICCGSLFCEDLARMKVSARYLKELGKRETEQKVETSGII